MLKVGRNILYDRCDWFYCVVVIGCTYVTLAVTWELIFFTFPVIQHLKVIVLHCSSYTVEDMICINIIIITLSVKYTAYLFYS